MNRVAGTATAGDRLAWTVFLAAAAHGMVILGVGFSPPRSGAPEEVPTLEVTLLEDPVPGQPDPADARYLAQASQAGAGNVSEQVAPEFHDTPPAPETPEAVERGPDAERQEADAEAATGERIASWAAPLQAAIARPRPKTSATERVFRHKPLLTAPITIISRVPLRPVCGQPGEPELPPAASLWLVVAHKNRTRKTRLHPLRHPVKRGIWAQAESARSASQSPAPGSEWASSSVTMTRA